MNYNFILQKNKYSFSYSPPIALVDEKLANERAKEISFFIRELQLYGVTLKDLYKSTPSFTEKNQLLNVSLAISKEESFIREFKAVRKLNIKRLNKYTEISKRHLEKWSSYLIAYILLFSNTAYDKITKYITIQLNEESFNSLTLYSPNSIEKNTGMVLETSNNNAVILTYHGEFLNIKTTDNPDLGTVSSGNLKKSLVDFKVPIVLIVFACIAFLLFGFTYYNISKSTVIVHHKSDYIITVNNLNRVIKVTSSTNKGRDILKSSKMKHKNIDNAILSLLQDMEKNNILTTNDTVTFIVSGSALDYNSLTKSETYLTDKKINADINNSGRTHKIQ